MEQWLAGRHEQELKETLLRDDRFLSLRLRDGTATQALIGAEIRMLSMPADSLNALVRRGDQQIIPHGDTRLETDDRITIIGDPAGIRELQERHGGIAAPPAGSGAPPVAGVQGNEDRRAHLPGRVRPHLPLTASRDGITQPDVPAAELVREPAMRPALFLVLGAAAASGCYSYVPVQPSEVSPGQEIRVRLTAEEAARYPDLRLSNRLMEGTLVEATEGEVVLKAGVMAGDPTRVTRVLMQQISLPRSGVLELELRQLNKGRTGLLVAGGGALLTAVIIESGGGFGRRENPPGDIVEARPIPLFRFRLGGR